MMLIIIIFVAAIQLWLHLIMGTSLLLYLNTITLTLEKNKIIIINICQNAVKNNYQP